MYNMGLFSKSDKDTKDNNKSITIALYNVFFRNGEIIQIMAEIHRFKSFLDGILSDSVNKRALDYLKEKFGKDIDEKEIEKVFLLYMLITTFIDILERASKYLSSFNTVYSLGYYLYRDENILGGKLDEKTFRELIWEINEYAKSVSSNEKDKQNKEQKDEQPK
jgi:hypothetical protein